MVVGESTEAGAANALPTPQTTAPTGFPNQAAVDNIMSGIGNTGTVKLNNHRKKLRQRFDIIKKLGQGTYGKVQLGINKETSQEVAIKTIKKCKIETEADLIRIRREVQIMSSVQHPNIIHIYEVFENREKMVLVMEFAAGGELYDYLSERKVLSEEEARRVFRQIATAVYYCHKHKICHRDLKLENILLDENGNAKIADFGLSNVFDEQRLLATFCGSPLYASPEIVKGTPYQGPEVDCWSLGVLLYTLVYGAMPFDGSNFKRLVKQISQGDYYEPKKPSPASPLIREMLTVCPQRRATIEQICNHWWVNEGYQESCLDLAEELANQTPVRLDVLLSLAPSSVTADQLVVPGLEDGKPTDRVTRSHSVGSIIDLANTEAERRIIDMVQAGGEAALMPSPTRTITPAESPAQPKRKLETTVSMENATGAKKKEKPTENLKNESLTIVEAMDLDPEIPQSQSEAIVEDAKEKEVLQLAEEAPSETVREIVEEVPVKDGSPEKKKVVKKKEEVVKEKTPVKKTASKGKTTDLAATIKEVAEEAPSVPSERKNSLPEENLTKPTERRRSRIFETAEKFQNMANQSDRPKKFVVPGGGGSSGGFKRDSERRASVPVVEATEKTTPQSQVQESSTPVEKSSTREAMKSDDLQSSDSKGSVQSFSLEEARKSMENSIALLNQARNESNPDVDQLCAKTENVAVSEENAERQRKLKNAREIIGIRKPPVPFGINGRSISGSVVPSATGSEKKSMRLQVGPDPSDMRTATFSVSTPEQKTFEREPLTASVAKPVAVGTSVEAPGEGTMKTSRAEIVLKSATLPRRKATKQEVQQDTSSSTKPEPQMRFSTEMQHQMPDLRSAPIREHSTPYSPLSLHQRAMSLEPQAREHFVPIARPSNYIRTTSSNPFRATSLSRQSTNESDTETTTTSATQSQQNVAAGGTNQPIKKSPREFIIPIAVEGGGYITPRAGSLEPSESTASGSTFRSTASRTKRIGSLLSERDSEEDSLFNKLHRHTSLTKESDTDEPRFHSMHRLRSTRPVKKINQDPSADSASSGEDDDEDGFEILTAENLFSTLLQRVRALTNRINVNNETTSGFPSSRFMSNLRQGHSPFWHHDPFGSTTHPSHQSYSYRSETVETKVTRLNNGGHPWRTSMTRDLTADIDSMFSRSTGATLPRGPKNKYKRGGNDHCDGGDGVDNGENLDLADLDLSQLRLTKKDLETLSSITPALSKRVQDQLLAKLPPNQAKKLSRTLSMQNNAPQNPGQRMYKRSLSGGRDISDGKPDLIKDVTDSGGKSTDLDRDNVFRRSLSRTRYDAGDKESRSSSRCRDSLRSSYSSDVSDKYKTYSPYSDNLAISLDRKSDYEKPPSPYRYYDTLPPRSSCMSPTKEYGRPPIGGCLSPPPVLSSDNSVLRRRSSQRRISRFLRPDFFDTPREESIYVADREARDAESQKILREIRERSRERSMDTYDRFKRDSSEDRLAYYSDKHTPDDTLNRSRKHLVNCPQYSVDPVANALDLINTRRRSLSRSRDLSEGAKSCESDLSLTDRILNELQSISRSKADTPQEEPVKVKVKKSKSKSDSSEKTEEKKVKKQKSKSKIPAKSDPNQSTLSANEMDLVKNLTEQINSVNLLLDNPSGEEKVKKESKLMRPKSYPSKEPEKVKKISPDKSKLALVSEQEVQQQQQQPVQEDKSQVRPKSFPNSKLTPPKELKELKKSLEINGIGAVEKIEKIDKVDRVEKIGKSSKSPPKTLTEPGSTPAPPKTTKKIVKIVKKSPPKSETSTPSLSEKIEKTPLKIEEIKEKSPEKKNRGFLYSISQKFEKLKENTKAKEKKNAAKEVPGKTVEKSKSKECVLNGGESIPKSEEVPVVVKKKKSKVEAQTEESREDLANKLDRKSKIDAMIRNLRERSVPRTSGITESGLIKRAVSVEDMSGAFNKCGVNRVLGLFKKIEKESMDGGNRVRNTKSIGNVVGIQQTEMNGVKERPKSSGFVSKLKKTYPYTGAKSDTIVTITEHLQKQQKQDKMNGNTKIPIKCMPNCPECGEEAVQVTKRHSNGEALGQSVEEKERIRNNRKGLMLDFTKLECCPETKRHSMVEPKVTNFTNNNLTNHSTTTEINQNHLHTPSSDYMASYSSDSRSPYDIDCGASTSTFFSPTDEPELYFDDWSVCSDDHLIVNSPPPLTKLSHHTPVHVISPQHDHPASVESIVDRIRRKSFYTRFNEKKPKRVSTIVGPAAKDYYRDTASRSKSRPPEYVKSPTVTIGDHSRGVHEYYRPLRMPTDSTTSSSSSSSKHNSAPVNGYRSSDFLSHRHGGGDYLTPTALRRPTYSTDLSYQVKSNPSNRSSLYGEGNSIYSTFSPKRRVSYASGGPIDTYATLGRKSSGLLVGKCVENGANPSNNFYVRTSSALPSRRSPTTNI
ncbi:serine-rich adhesin for platelets isoform X3 [Phlebotomus papatasi]|uniref:serine-rich adhesin for platelets isoform X3 n=1 Tax=Phlebotomus papatasi TaxID=29031 RepID=UPI0024846CFB|nr:serine-rich adhesin for platelets isoform X3 [Phlebotomus papatasi]